MQHRNRGLTAVALAAAAGAAALPITSLGIGWPISALAVAGAAWATRQTEPVPEGPGEASLDRAWRFAAGAAALVLSAVPAVRASETLAVLCLASAGLLGSYALAGGRTWRGLVVGMVALAPGLVRGLGWAASQTSGPTRRAGRIAGGVLTGLILLAVFVPLLRSADPAFANLLDSWLRILSRVDIARAAAGAVLMALAAVAAANVVRTRVDSSSVDRRRTLHAVEWAIPLVLVDLLFGVFVWVQVTVLFGGHDYVLGVGGPDYAAYARGGFAQLGIVTALTLGLVAGLGLWARRDTARDLGLIRALGGLLCLLTLVIVGSALKRLGLYADAYGFTWPRLLGFAGELWLGLVFVLFLLAGIRMRADWLPRTTAAAAVVVLLGLVAVNPEGLMARTVLDRLGGPYPVDLGFVRGLSADAVDEIQRLPVGYRDCALLKLRVALKQPDPWYQLNLARQYARTAIAGRVNYPYGCHPYT